MTRTIISLEVQDKQWLERRAAAEGVPMTELVREAIRRMRQQEDLCFDDLLQQTSGLWRHGDGLAYQRRVRREWR
ncbi:MAG: CopG family transcriptional regulator [Acidobacteria bacterium]|nr:CopG family transcriptional regulator [Acidobacteriota bacterium]